MTTAHDGPWLDLTRALEAEHLRSLNLRECPRCGGSGEIRFLRRPPDPQTEEGYTCGRCQGDGVLGSG